MGNFLYPVSFILNTQLNASSATVAASPDVKSKKRNGRQAVGISATSGNIYVGGADVSSSNGLLIPSGSSVIIPVVAGATDPVWVCGGSCTITEFF